MLEALEQDHATITELADRLEECLDDDSPEATARTRQLRWALAREVVRHTMMEDRILYQMLEETDPDTLRAHHDAFPYARTSLFLQRLQLHNQCWSGEAAIRNRPDYIVATREVLGILRARMALEERVLYPRFAEILRAREARTAGSAATAAADPAAAPINAPRINAPRINAPRINGRRARFRGVESPRR